MATPVMMPKVGISVESCILTEWHKKVGDKVNVGDVLFTYETDKSTMDEVSEVEGVMLAQFAEEGDDVVVMTNVCVIGNEGESFAEFAPAGAAEDAPAAEEAPKAEAAPVAAASVAAAPAAPQDGFVKVSPRAKHLAESAGVDYRYAAPTGAEGRIIERDIRNLIENGPSATYAAAGAFEGAAGTGIGGKFSVADIGAAPAAAAQAPVAAAPEADFVDEKLSGIRKVIAKAMHKQLTEKYFESACGHPDTCTCEICEARRKTEHMRWNAYMRSEGYVKGVRNDRAKTHPNLCTWDELPYLDRFKD